MITISIIFYKIIQNYEVLFSLLKKLNVVLTPFFWAFGIAFLLNPLMKKIETYKGMSRTRTLVVMYTLLIGLLSLLVIIVTPRIISSVTEIVVNMPGYYNRLQMLLSSVLESKFISDTDVNEFLSTSTRKLADSVFDYLNHSATKMVSRVIDLTSAVLQFIVGLIISIYMLYDKEMFQDSFKKILFHLLEKKNARKIIEWGSITNSVFTDFFIGKSLDSLIIGILCGIGLSIIGAPYPFLLALIVGIFNMIPYVGPFIGAVPAVFFTLLSDPLKALWVVLFIFVLQQFDGNILGPKILGDRLGVRPIYVMLAIFVGGGFFGMFGMLVGVPVFKLISIALAKLVEDKDILQDTKG
ncbi:MAG: AI-2E family transporter [Filifactor alocis]|nr:AI-2E family transporter [Filifactor alocis]